MRAFPRAIPAPLRPHPPRRRWTRGTESMSTPLLGAGRPRAHPAYERDQPTRTPHGKNSLERFRPRCPRLTVTASSRGEVVPAPPFHPTLGWAGLGTGSASPAPDITGTRSGAVLGPGEVLPG